MVVAEPSLTIGIEEEYLLVDRKTRDLAKTTPKSMVKECKERCEGQVSPEFLRAQIEVGTPVNTTIQGVRKDLASSAAHRSRSGGSIWISSYRRFHSPIRQLARPKAHQKSSLQYPGKRPAWCGQPIVDMRYACTRRYRGSRAAYRYHESTQLFSSSFTRLELLVTVLGRL